MNKDEAVKWMLDGDGKEKLATNEFSAGHIWEGLSLWNYDTADQKELVVLYRRFRKTNNDTKKCFQLALDAFALAKAKEKDAKAEKEDERNKTIRSLGFYE